MKFERTVLNYSPFLTMTHKADKMMQITRPLVVAALGVLLLVPARGEAQVSASATCTPGIPGCTSVRFFIQATGGVDIDQLFIQSLNPAWHFTSGPNSTTGTYSAIDSYGPYGGFTTLNASGSTLSIDFLDNGFPFSVLDGDTGLFDVEASGEPDASNFQFGLQGTTDEGGTFEVTSAPEPATTSLLATGLVGLAGIARKRRRRAKSARA